MTEEEKNRAFMEKLVKMKMPYGKHKDTLLLRLPEHYVIWLKNNALPKGELGKMIELVYEIKLNGLEYLFKDFK